MGNDEIGYLKYLPAFILVEILMYHQAGSDRHSEKIKQNNNVRVSKIPQSIYWIFVDAHSEISLNPGPLILWCSITNPALRIMAQKPFQKA